MAMQQCPMFTTVELQTFRNIYTSMSKVTALYHFTQREWFYGTLSLAIIKTTCGPHVKSTTFSFNFSQIWIFTTDLNKSSQKQISCTLIKWEPRWYMWKNRRMKGQTTRLTGTFCGYANTRKTHLRYSPFCWKFNSFLT
jgi:hypothetical protein